MSLPSIKLTYFNIEAAAEPTRLALTLAGVPFEDERVSFPEWGALKPTTPYGQLPLMVVNGEPNVRTQSGAMLRYAGTLVPEKQLYPADSLYEVEEAIALVEDMKTSWTPCLYLSMRPQKFGYPEKFGETDEGKALIKSLREKWIQEELPARLGFIAARLEKNGGKWLASKDKPTIADCYAVPFIRQFSKGFIDHVDPKCLEINPTIVDYIKRFCALEEVKGRYDSGIF